MHKVEEIKRIRTDTQAVVMEKNSVVWLSRGSWGHEVFVHLRGPTPELCTGQLGGRRKVAGRNIEKHSHGL